jgi:putative redox protein
MSTTPPRRIAQLDIHIHVPHSFAPEIQTGLEKAALSCPVHESLHPDIKQNIAFAWGKTP